MDTLNLTGILSRMSSDLEEAHHILGVETTPSGRSIIAVKHPETSSFVPFCPEHLVQPFNRGIIVRYTMSFFMSETEGGIVFAQDKKFEKKFSLGEVIAIGPMVDGTQINVGDILVYQSAAAFRIPNGTKSGADTLFKAEWGDSLCCIVRLPNPKLHLRGEHWRGACEVLEPVPTYADIRRSLIDLAEQKEVDEFYRDLLKREEDFLLRKIESKSELEARQKKVAKEPR